MKEVILYTDGACSYNPGPGGWGCVLMWNGIEKEISGYEPETTNNRMELTAVIKGLQCLKEKVNVKIYTDSAYVCNAFEQKWIETWQLKNWKNSQKKEVSNIDLWQQLLDELSKHNYTFIKVKGHSTNEYNNRCDKLATAQVAKHINKNE